MINWRRWLTILIVLLALAGLSVLAIGLPRQEFKTGQSFQLPEKANALGQAFGDATTTQRTYLTLHGLLIAVIIIYFIYILVNIRNRKGRKQILKDLLIMAAMVAIMLWYRPAQEQEILIQAKPDIQDIFLIPGGDAFAPLAIFNPNAAPRWAPIGLLFAIALILAALAGVIAWWSVRPRRKGAIASSSAQEEISEQAGLAVKAIEDGDEVRDVILRTYYNMERILEDQRGVYRKDSATPAEFAQALDNYGLPRGAVWELTHLFEEVRYGDQLSSPAMQQRALSAFNAIKLLLPTTE